MAYQAGTAFVRVVPDLNGFQNRIQRELRGIGGTQTVRVQAQTDKRSFGEALKSAANLQRALGTLAKPAALTAAVPSVLALASALTQAAGAALLLPAALVAGGAAIGTLKLGLTGLSDTFKALSAADKSAAQDSASAGKQRAAAAKAVSAAEQNLRQAQQRAKDSQDNLNQARKDAVEQLQQLQFSLRGTALDEKQAVIDLAKAQEDLAAARAAGAGSRDLEELDIAAQQAALRLDEIRDRYGDLQAEGHKWAQSGIEGSAGVQAATRDVADAQDAAQQAQVALTEAIVASSAKATASQQAVGAAMANLSPQAQVLVDKIRALKPAWDDLRLDVQDRLLVGIGTSITQLATNYLPALKSSLGGIADGFNRAFRQSAGFLNNPTVVRDIAVSMGLVSTAVQTASTAIQPLVSAFKDIFAVGATFLPGLAQGFADAAVRAGEFISQARESGQLAGWIQGGIDAFKLIGQIIGNVAEAVGAVFSAIQVSGGGTLQLIADLTQRIADFLNSAGGQAALAAIFTAIKQTVDALTPALMAILAAAGQVLVTLAPLFGPLATAISNIVIAILPLVEPLTKIILLFGEMLTKALVAVTPLITILAQVIVDILNAGMRAMVPVFDALIRVITDLAGPIGEIARLLGDGLVRVLDMLAPILPVIVEAFGTMLVTALQALIPLLPPVIQAILDILAAVLPLVPLFVEFGVQLIKAIVPILPALVDLIIKLVYAVLPLLPPLIRVVEKLLPGMSSTIEFLMPILIWLIDVLGTGLAWVIKYIVVPIIVTLIDIWDKLGDGIDWVWVHVIKPAWDAIVNGLKWVRDKFQDAVAWIGEKWDGLKRLLAKPINFLIETVWNNGVRKAWNVIADLLPGIDPVAPLDKIPEYARGGPITGGTPGKDSVLAKLMPGEYVLPTRMARSIGYDNLDRARGAALQGRPVATEGMFNGLPGFSQGGRVEEAKRWAQAQDNKPYQWGGVGNPSFDCSGYMSGIQNVLMGRPALRRLYTTSQFSPGRAPAGLVPGTSSAFTVGVQPGHMAGTLDGINVESAGGGKGVQFGPPARGTSSFPMKFSLPSAGGEFKDGGGGGGGLWSWLTDMFSKIVDVFETPARAAVNAMPFNAPPAFMGVPKNIGNWIVDSAVSLFKGDAEKNDTGGGGSMGPGSGPVVDQVKAVANTFGWGGGVQWDSLSRLIQKESSWNPLAQNPRSTAFGLFQFLNSTWAGVGGSKTGNPGLQAQYGLKYIKQRYQDPVGALNFHNRNNWYDQGGWLPPGLSTVYNGTGKPEPVLTRNQLDELTGGTSGSGALIGRYEQHFHGQERTEDALNALSHRLRVVQRSG